MGSDGLDWKTVHVKRTKASGMMVGFPFPGAQVPPSRKPPAVAHARRCRVARAAARGRPHHA